MGWTMRSSLDIVWTLKFDDRGFAFVSEANGIGKSNVLRSIRDIDRTIDTPHA
ncbi:MAG: hypothetical protein J7642_13990 [Cyanobacteria bacterium SBC]|nr:hypothetical protein [Cyanobacteria bacterium SBC]